MLPAWANMKHISYGGQVQVGSAATLATYDGAPKMELLGVSWPPLMHAKSIKSSPNTIARGCVYRLTKPGELVLAIGSAADKPKGAFSSGRDILVVGIPHAAAVALSRKVAVAVAAEAAEGGEEVGEGVGEEGEGEGAAGAGGGARLRAEAVVRGAEGLREQYLAARDGLAVRRHVRASPTGDFECPF